MSSPGRCTSCNRKPAIYLRKASGERLCSACFEVALIKAIKRSLRELKGRLVPGTRILSIVIPERLVESLALLYLLNKVERKYGCNVIATLLIGDSTDLSMGAFVATLKSANLIDSVENVLILRLANRYKACLEPQTFKDLLMLCCRIAISVDVNIIALPLTLNDVNSIIIDSFLSGNLDNAPVEQPISVGEIMVAVPLHKVPVNEVYAFSYVRGLYTQLLDTLIPRMQCNAKQRIIKELVSDLTVNNPELVQTLGKLIKMLRTGHTQRRATVC